MVKSLTPITLSIFIITQFISRVILFHPILTFHMMLFGEIEHNFSRKERTTCEGSKPNLAIERKKESNSQQFTFLQAALSQENF